MTQDVIRHAMIPCPPSSLEYTPASLAYWGRTPLDVVHPAPSVWSPGTDGLSLDGTGSIGRSWAYCQELAWVENVEARSCFERGEGPLDLTKKEGKPMAEDLAAGYSSESLRMLESKEGQLNAVFACFGSAAQHAQLFEQSLSRFLEVYNRIQSDSISVRDLEKKATMGQLIRKVRHCVTFDDPWIEEGFSVALRQRNHLIHRFFLERGGELESKKGRLRLLAELVEIERVLDRCRVMVNAMRIAMCRTLAIRDPWADDYSCG